MQRDAFSREVIPGVLRRNYSRFTVGDELLHGTVDGYPSGVDGLDEGLFCFVRNDECGMSSRASIQHVENDELVHEQEIALDLLVEGIGEVYTACIAWTKLGPLPAY